MNHLKFKWQAFCAILLLTACTKIDSTRLGNELIPVVDNVNTFETILPVVANNYIGNEEYRLNASNPHVVGAISDDPLFGRSRATMFFEMKPASYPFIFEPYDKINGNGGGFDSAVLILEYQTYYGDSGAPVNLKLYEADRKILPDTAIKPTYNLQPDLAPNLSRLWGSKTVNANRFKDSLSIMRADSLFGKVNKQLRIRLDDNLAKFLFFGDTLTLYQSDSLFKEKMPGFALEADATANTLLYFNLLGTSKVEFYYRTKDSTTTNYKSASFAFTSRSGHAVKFDRDRSGAELNASLIPDEVNGQENIYIQTSPGTSAAISIPGLDTFKMRNRVIHRAELRITQVENTANTQLLPPQALFLDVMEDSANNIYKGIPYDLSPFSAYYCYPASGINYGYFGGFTFVENVSGKDLAVYRFNITRYLQAVVSRDEPVYDFRLSAPFYTYYENCANTTGTYPQNVFPFTASTSSTSSALLNVPGKGRIKLAGGNTVDSNIRMQLRIIYSAL